MLFCHFATHTHTAHTHHTHITHIPPYHHTILIAQSCHTPRVDTLWPKPWKLTCHFRSPALDRQALICTCSSPNNNPTTYGQTTTHSTRSRSVPEGLSTMSKQCNCRHGSGTIPGLGQGPGSGPTREFIYVPHAYASLQRTPTHRQGQRSGEAGSLGGGGACSALRSNPQCRLKRSQSLCRPTAVQFVEQITTSV